jgi:hypothetical protein
LVLFFSDHTGSRPGGRGGPDIWLSTRPNIDSPFGPPLNLNDLGLGSTLNGSSWDGWVSISRDWPAPGAKIYFSYWSGSGSIDADLWEADWVPFRFTGCRPTPNGFELDFSTKANRAFQVQFRDDLDSSEWTSLGAPITATSETMSVTDPIPPDGRNRFYRVIAP